jgi:hypothetical protein
MDVEARRGLAETVAKVRDRASQLRERREGITEQDTKRILIEPILSALGWCLEDLDDVRSEYRHKPQDNPADYALFVFGKPCLFLEAKALSNALDHHKCASQVLGYASMVGVGWCLVTNGDEYRLYNSHAAVGVEEKLFRTIRLSDPAQMGYCLETLALLAKDEMGEKALEILWKSQFIDRRVSTAVADVLTGDDGSFARLVHKRTPELALADVRESLKRARLSLDFPSISALCPSAEQEKAQAFPAENKAQPKRGGSRARLADLIAAHVVDPPLQLEATYKGVRLSATVDASGFVVFEGKPHGSPSAAGGAAKGSVLGSPADSPMPATDGWWFWQYEDPETGSLRYVDELRQRYLMIRDEVG